MSLPMLITIITISISVPILIMCWWWGKRTKDKQPDNSWEQERIAEAKAKFQPKPFPQWYCRIYNESCREDCVFMQEPFFKVTEGRITSCPSWICTHPDVHKEDRDILSMANLEEIKLKMRFDHSLDYYT